MSGRETFFNFILFPDFSPTRGRKSLGDPLPLLLRLLPLLKSYPIAIVKDNLTLVQVSTKSKKVIISQLYRFYIRNWIIMHAVWQLSFMQWHLRNKIKNNLIRFPVLNPVGPSCISLPDPPAAAAAAAAAAVIPPVAVHPRLGQIPPPRHAAHVVRQHRNRREPHPSDRSPLSRMSEWATRAGGMTRRSWGWRWFQLGISLIRGSWIWFDHPG